MNSTPNATHWVRDGVTRKLHLKDANTDLATYVTLSWYPDGRPSNLGICANRLGSLEHGLLHLVGVLVSVALQGGIPPGRIIEKMEGMQFEPAGFTGQPDIPSATSIADYLAKWMKLQITKEGTNVHCED
jgi:hypothetical protein